LSYIGVVYDCADVFQIYIDAQYTDLKLPIDILIGTVPLRESLQNLPAPWYDNTVVTMQPASAPSINDQSDYFDLRMSYLLYYLRIVR